MKQFLNNFQQWVGACKEWAGFAGRTALQSFQGSMQLTSRSLLQGGIAAGAAFSAILLILTVVTTALAALFMQGGLTPIWSICSSAFITAVISSIIAWVSLKNARRSVATATKTPQATLAALPLLPSPMAFLSPTKPSFSPPAFFDLTPNQTKPMNTSQVQNELGNIARQLSNSLESIFSNNLGNSLQHLAQSAWKWVRKNPVAAGLIGAGVGGAAVIASVRSASNHKPEDKLSKAIDDAGEEASGLVNRLSGTVRDRLETFGNRARNGAAAVSETIREAATTATKTAQQATRSLREKTADLSDWAHDATDRAADVASNLRDSAEDAWDKGSRYVKQNPGTAAVGLLAAGLLAGFILSKSNKSA